MNWVGNLNSRLPNSIQLFPFFFFSVFVNGLLKLLNHFSFFGKRHKDLRDMKLLHISGKSVLGEWNKTQRGVPTEEKAAA